MVAVRTLLEGWDDRSRLEHLKQVSDYPSDLIRVKTWSEVRCTMLSSRLTINEL